MKKLFLFLIISLFLIGTTLAFEFDNIKSYDSTLKEVTIKDSVLGIPTTNVAKVQLLSEQRVLVDVDKCIDGWCETATLKINLYENDYQNALKSINLYNLQKTASRENPTKIMKRITIGTKEVDDIQSVCQQEKSLNLTGGYTTKCKNQVVGKKTVEEYSWEEVNSLDLLKGETYIKVYTKLNKGESLEWIPTLFGVDIEEWATILDGDKKEWNDPATHADSQASGTTTAFAQTFKTGNMSNGAFILEGVSLYFAANADNGIIRISIVNLTAGFPNINQVVSDNSTINSSGLTGWNNFTLPNFPIANQSELAIVLWNTSNGNIQWGETTSNEYKGGNSFFDSVLPIGTFTNNSNYDMMFSVWGEEIVDVTTKLNTPANDFTTFSPTINFSANLTSTGTLANATLYVWKPNGTNSTNFTTITGTTNQSNLSLSGLTVANGYKWNIFGCSTTVCIFGDENRTFNIDLFEENAFYDKDPIVELSEGLFILNISNGGEEPIAPYLNYNGSKILASVDSISSTSFKIYTNFTIPATNGSDQTKNWLFQFNLSGSERNSTQQTQNITTTSFQLCSPTNNVPYLNISFKDEDTNSNIFANVTAATIFYWSNVKTSNKTLTFTNSSDGSASYSFCYKPASENVTIDISLSYKGSDYPQRTFENNNLVLSNVTTNQTLYLLSTTQGITHTLIVQDASGVPISGATVDVTRVVGSSTEAVGSGTTGDDGSVTFFLNPDFSHTFAVSKTGYTPETVSYNPTLETRVVTLTSTTTVTAPPDYYSGIAIHIQPIGDYLNNHTTYNFNYTINSTNWTLDSFGFYLYYRNGSLIGTQSSVSGTGGVIGLNANTLNSSRIIMNYYYVVNSTYINYSRYWTVSITNDYSIKHFFGELDTYLSANLLGFLGDDGTADFGKALLSVVILVLVTGTLSYRYGIVSEAAIMGAIFGIVLTLNSLRFIPEHDFLGSGVSLGGLLSAITLLMLFAFIIKGEQR